MAAKGSDPIHIKPSHKGRLHEALGIPEDELIPVSDLERAKGSDSPALRREANFALNAHQFKHAGGKG